MEKLSLRDLPLKGKRVLMRVDFNVPLASDGSVSDDSRIQAALPSIRYCLDQGCSLVLMSHLGRPEGKPNAKYSLSSCAKRLSELLDHPVQMAPDCIGPQVEHLVANLQPAEILLLENLRFHPAEEDPSSDPSFASSLAKWGDVYVNDAFGTAHRSHASTATIAQYFPHKAAAGFLMEKEISILSNLLLNPKRPFYAILGGAKVSSKVGVIKNLLTKVDALFIGGAMAYPFLNVKGIYMGGRPIDPTETAKAKEILKEAEERKIPCWLPIDLMVAQEFKNDAPHRTLSVREKIPDGWLGMGIGPQTVSEWVPILQKGQTIFWNGPLSVFEMENFSLGTFAIAQKLAELSCTTVIGGGDSVSAIQKIGLNDRFTHLSTGGGATLEFIEFGHLPGIDALSNR